MSNSELDQLRQNFLEARQALADAQKYRSPESVDDYVFETADASVHLSDLFADKSDLFVIHNMGTGCAYCTLWADGFNGVFEHLQNRASVVISSPDSVEVQQQFRHARDWRFEMISTANNRFAEDMGYRNENGSHPGVSVFTKAEGKVFRVADTPFGPGDDYCSVWHLFDLLPDGANGWQPRCTYLV